MRALIQIIGKFRKVKLSASTLIETITASVIFMIVFVIAMDALTAIMTHDTKDSDYIVVENEISKLRRNLIDNTEEIRAGDNVYEFGWGEIRLNISEYRNNGIFLVDIDAVSLKGRRMADYRFLLTD